MRADAGRFHSGRPAKPGAALPRHEPAARALLAALFVAAALAPSAQASLPAAGARISRTHAICSGSNSARVPCRFSTPSGNIRCIWTPRPNSVACKLRATGRAYRLRPTGRATVVRLMFARSGQTLPLDQQIVFPDSLSCRDTRRSMVCNQDFGSGAFTLSPSGSHRS